MQNLESIERIAESNYITGVEIYLGDRKLRSRLFIHDAGVDLTLHISGESLYNLITHICEYNWAVYEGLDKGRFWSRYSGDDSIIDLTDVYINEDC